MRIPRLLIELRESMFAAFRALRANTLRSILTTVGIVVGVTAVIAIVSLIQGLDRTFAQSVSSLGTRVIYIGKFPWVITGDFWRYRNRKDITLEQARALAAALTLPEAVSYSSGASLAVKWRERTTSDIQIEGHNVQGRIVHALDPLVGRFFTDNEDRERRPVAIIGHGVWRNLFEGRDPLGQRVRIGGQPFTVIGVLPEQGSLLGQDQDTRVVIPLQTLMKLWGGRRSLQISLLAPDEASIDLVADEARGIMRRLRRVPPGQEDDFAVNRQEMLLEIFRNLTRGLAAVLVGVAALSLLVGGIGIMNIMLVSVTERTREIGIRKSVGAKRRDILYQFLVESVVVSGVGGVIGIGLGLGIAFAISALTPLPAAAPLWAILLGLGFSSAVGLFFGLYPAAKAARLDPIEALRYE
jgi:putative ABC transport system permease protein